MIKRFASYYRPHLKLFILDMICAFAAACCDLFYPLIAKNIINDYVPNQNVRLFAVWAAVLLGIYALKAGLNYFIQYWGHIVGLRIQGDMRRDLFTHLERLPFTFFDGHKTGAVMSRMVNDLLDVSELAHHGPENLFLSLIILAGAFIMLGTINIALTCLVFAVLPFMLLFAYKVRPRMTRAFRDSREKTAEINASVETSIAGIRVSKAYTAAEHETKKFEAVNENLKSSRAAAYRQMGIFNSGMTFLTDLLYLIVLAAGGAFFLRGRIDAGEFTAYLLFVTMFLKPVNRLVAFYEQFQEGMTGFGRFCEIMDMPEEEADASGLIDAGRLGGAIRFENVSFSYENGDGADRAEPVIKDLTMEIEKGETLALVGPSGSGKTTMCHLIPRFYEISSGRITIDGIDIGKMTRYSLRRNIGIVAQDVFLFSGTIRENIAYGDLDAGEDRIIEAAKKANIHDYIMSLKDGYDTEVGERGVKLSGGQKQRISIARAFLKNPPILILDEATSSLDNTTEMMIQKSLDELGKDRTSIIVAHRLSTIKHADKIIVLSSSGIEESGTHEELLAAGGMYAKLYRYQFRS